MSPEHLTISFIRRGFSASGGAESYLMRLARGISERGHAANLFTSGEWPPDAWPFGKLTHVRSRSPREFADKIQRLQLRDGCDVVFSLERVWSCDVYRAGDGVHQSWLARRAKFATPWEKVSHSFNRKHIAILALERSLFARGGAARVVANSEMVRRDLIEFYAYPAEKIDLVRNGIPVAAFASSAELRDRSRRELKLAADEIAALFVGSGWERKGLRFAIDAIEQCQDPRLRLFVVGRGNEGDFRSRSVRFLDVVTDLRSLYAAADVFILPTLYDPFSNACLEAMASGLPVITTRANGFAEIVTQNVHGTIVNSAADVPALREAISYWSDAERRTAAKPLIQAHATAFDISENVERTLAILVQAASAESTSGKIRKT